MEEEICRCKAPKSEHEDYGPAPNAGGLARTNCFRFTWDGKSGPYAPPESCWLCEGE